MRLALLPKTTIKLDKYMRQLFSNIEQQTVQHCNFEKRHTHEANPIISLAFCLRRTFYEDARKKTPNENKLHSPSCRLSNCPDFVEQTANVSNPRDLVRGLRNRKCLHAVRF